jgi:hypothetical protein
MTFREFLPCDYLCNTTRYSIRKPPLPFSTTQLSNKHSPSTRNRTKQSRVETIHHAKAFGRRQCFLDLEVDDHPVAQFGDKYEKEEFNNGLVSYKRLGMET